MKNSSKNNNIIPYSIKPINLIINNDINIKDLLKNMMKIILSQDYNKYYISLTDKEIVLRKKYVLKFREFVYFLRLNSIIIFHSIFIFDILICLNKLKKNYLELNFSTMSLGAVILSIKFLTNQNGFNYKKLKYYNSEIIYTFNDLFEIELKCLILLNYKLNFYNPYFFMEFLLLNGIVFNTDNIKMEDSSKVYASSVNILEQIMIKSNEYVKYNPFLLSSGIVGYCRGKFNIEIWPEFFYKIFGIKYKNINNEFSFIDKIFYNKEKLNNEVLHQERNNSHIHNSKINLNDNNKNYNQINSYNKNNNNKNNDEKEYEYKIIKKRSSSMDENMYNTQINNNEKKLEKNINSNNKYLLNHTPIKILNNNNNRLSNNNKLINTYQKNSKFLSTFVSKPNINNNNNNQLDDSYGDSSCYSDKNIIKIKNPIYNIKKNLTKDFNKIYNNKLISKFNFSNINEEKKNNLKNSINIFYNFPKNNNFIMKSKTNNFVLYTNDNNNNNNNNNNNIIENTFNHSNQKTKRNYSYILNNIFSKSNNNIL